MAFSLMELVLLVAAILGLYKLMRPVQEMLERAILKLLSPGERRFIDAEVLWDEIRKKRKE